MGNDNAIINLPVYMTGLKNEVIVQKTHRYGYDHALRNCGIKFVDVDTLDDYEAAFNEKTVMAHFFMLGEGGKISRETGLASPTSTAYRASTTLPPTCRRFEPRKHTQMGFDLVDVLRRGQQGFAALHVLVWPQGGRT